MTVIQGDCLEVMRGMPDSSVDLICADPPYYKVKGEEWDNQWKTPALFLSWLGDVADEWKRILKPNGSLYCFASPQMSHGVEGVIRERFNVLTNIRWRKPPFSTKAEMFTKEDLRCPFPASETIIFAEQSHGDEWADGEAGYSSKCEAAKVAVFGDYLRSEMARAGVNGRQVATLFPSRTGGLTGCVSNWLLGLNCPTSGQYATIRAFLNECGGEYLTREYEELRLEYEELRRPFSATPDDPYTDVWDFATVGYYKGKHVCEKPLPLIRHIVALSSRPGGVVLDSFAGSGTTGEAALELGRQPILIEKSPEWCEKIRQRLTPKPDLFTVAA